MIMRVLNWVLKLLYTRILAAVVEHSDKFLPQYL